MADEKKLIIDEDWKSQVEAERQQAKATPVPEAKQSVGGSATAAEPREVQFPPASFELLLTTLATEALMSMGQVPNPMDGRVSVHREQARYIIDTIEMLQQKTKGNLSSQEQLTIDNMLHQLRMAFVETSK